MNSNTYQLIWNMRLGTWVAVSELAKRGKKRGSIRRDLLILPLLALYTSFSFALPTGNELVAGSASVTTPAAGHLQINQSSQNAIINWQGYSIGAHESVTIQQPNASAVQLNRVVGQDPSMIQGQLNANGQVYLINPNGVVFSKTAQVDVGGLIASTHSLSDADFLNGKLHFTQDHAKGGLSNEGQITTAKGGVVALIGEQVTNTGSINTPQGTTVLAAGKTIDLDMKGDGLVEVKVTEAALNAEIKNAGIIQADGGQVLMTAQSASQLLKTVINNEGVVEARGLMEKNGSIVLSGGDNGVVQVGGTLDVSGQSASPSPNSNLQGGKITVSGEQIQVNSNAVLNASGDAGGGNIVIGDKQSTDQTTVQAGANLAAQALDHGKAGTIAVLANMDKGVVAVAGKLDASAPKQGDGGFIETSAAQVKVADTANITSKAANGKSGTWLIDPYDFIVASSGGDITGTALTAALSGGDVTIQTAAASVSCTGVAGCGAGNSNGNGDIFVNDAVSWSAHTFTLNAYRNININADLNGSFSASLVLIYGQGTVALNNASNIITHGASVNLPAGTTNLTTKQGSDGALQSYTVITSLGAANSSTTTDLQGMKGNLGLNYALGSDIVNGVGAGDMSTWNGGTGFTPVGNSSTPFTGSFNGLGHTISGFTINRPGSDFQGLFGYAYNATVGNNATISNIGLAGGSVIGNNYVGGLVGASENKIINSHATGTVLGSDYVGGLTGFNGSLGIISNSYATGSVTDKGNSTYIGGLVGFNNHIISNSYATGSVSGNGSFANIGGLVGYSSIGTISNSYATGSVSGLVFASLGGLVGLNGTSSIISNSYATGRVDTGLGSANFGGLVGSSAGTVNTSFWDTQTTGQATSSGGTGLTTAQMMTQASYPQGGGQWDFTNAWWMVDGATRPFLQMEYSTSISNAHQLQMMAMHLSANYTLANNLDLTTELAAVNGQYPGMWGSSGFAPVGFLFTGNFAGLGHTISNLTINRPNENYVGLFAKVNGSSISDLGMINVNVTGLGAVGGLLGLIEAGGSISNVYVTGNVSGDFQVGGMLGYNYVGASISNAYAKVSVNGNTQVGGLAGTNFGSISNAYATGIVNNGISGVGVGGLVGLGNSSVTNAFWDTQATRQSVSAGGIGKTTAEMMLANTFSTWNISATGGSGGIWRIYEGHTTPLLISLMTPLTLTDAPDFSITYNRLAQGGATTAIGGILGAVASGTNAGFYNGYYSSQQGYDIIGGNLTINPANLSLSTSNVVKTYDGGLTAAGVATVTGGTLFSGDTLSGGTFAYINKDVGSGNKTVTASGITVNDANSGNNYLISYANNIASTINPALLSVTAIASGKTYGGVDPMLSYTASGFVANETSSVLTGALTRTVGETVDGGPYAITQGSLANSNYTISYAGANFIINPVSLTYTANSGTRVYGAADPVYTGSVTGFVNGETLSNVTIGTASFTGSATNTSNVGSYAITGSGLSANNGNYIFTQAASNEIALNITPTSLSVTANGFSKTEDNLAYTGGNGVTYAGLVNNETPSVLTGNLAYSGNSQGAINVGSYTITPGGLSSGNYMIAYLDGLLSIASAPVPPYIPTNIPPVLSFIPFLPANQPVDSLTNPTVKDTTNNFTSNSSSILTNILPVMYSGSEKQREIVQPTLKIKNGAGRIKRLQMDTNKHYLSLLLDDGEVRVWDLQAGLQRQINTQHSPHDLTAIGSVNANGESLAIASSTDIGTYDIIGSAIDDKSAITKPDTHHFVASKDGNLLLVNAGLNELGLWDNKQAKMRWDLPYQRGEVHALVMTDNQRYAAVLSRQANAYVLPSTLQLQSVTDAIELVDLTNGAVIQSLPNLGEHVVYMQFKDNETLQLGLASGELLDWPVATNTLMPVANFAETVTAVDVANNSYAYLLNDGTVRVGNGQGRIQMSIKNEENPFKYAKLVEGDNKLLTMMDNGELSIWDVASGVKMLRLFSTKQGWTAMDAYGRFDGSEAALENFTWAANEVDIPLDSFSENYYEPGLVSNVLHNHDYLNSNPVMVKEGITLPPKVALQIAAQQVNGDQVALQLDVYDRGGGIDKIHVYQNGKLLNNEKVITAQQTSQNQNTEHRILALNVSPSSGKNTVKVIASNDMGIENSSSELSFDGKTKASSSPIRILTIGIDKYSDSSLNLDYSVADANAIGQSLSKSSKVASSKSLYNENATKPKILAELKEISHGDQQDTLIIYFAGHGMAVGKEWYFLPYETKMQPTVEQIAAAGITATELSDIFKDTKMQHILVMIDSCYSGAATDSFNKLQIGQHYITRNLSRSLGITMITSAAKDKEAYELSSLGHGLFTYLMTQDIQNEGANHSAHGIAENIVKTLPAFSKKMVGASQEPIIYTKGNNFMLIDASKGELNPATPSSLKKTAQ